MIGFVPTGRGQDVLPALDDAISHCDGDTIDGWDAAISALSFPAVGEDLTAYRITLTHPDSDQSTHFDVVYAVSGDLATVVYAFDVYGDPTDTLATYAPRAIRHAIQALGTTPPAE